MALDSIITSPHRRSQTQTAFSSTDPKKNQYSRSNELGSCSTVLQRHRFLLIALGLLAFLCTIYLYFAVTLGAGDSCSDLTGTQKAACYVEHGKAHMGKGKLKFFQQIDGCWLIFQYMIFLFLLRGRMSYPKCLLRFFGSIGWSLV